MITVSLERLLEIIDHAKNRAEFGNMVSNLSFSIKKHPNGREYLEIEQECQYHECNSNYYCIESKS
jgi:hypothetical protein